MIGIEVLAVRLEAGRCGGGAAATCALRISKAPPILQSFANAALWFASWTGDGAAWTGRRGRQ